MRRHPVTAARLLVAALASTLTVALTAAGCTLDDFSAEPPGGPDASAAAPLAPLEDLTSFGSVTGELPDARRMRLKRRVSEVVDGWFSAAYLGRPRADLEGTFPGFTPRAAADARGDSDLMTNAGLGAEIVDVEPALRRLRLDVLAPDGKATAVTARFELEFEAHDADGEVRDAERVAGSLFLTEGRQGWQVFGYDVKRGQRRAATDAA